MKQSHRDRLISLIDRMQQHGFPCLSLKKDYERKYGVKLYVDNELSAPTVIKRAPNGAMKNFRVADSMRKLIEEK